MLTVAHTWCQVYLAETKAVNNLQGVLVSQSDALACQSQGQIAESGIAWRHTWQSQRGGWWRCRVLGKRGVEGATALQLQAPTGQALPRHCNAKAEVKRPRWHNRAL